MTVAELRVHARTLTALDGKANGINSDTSADLFAVASNEVQKNTNRLFILSSSSGGGGRQNEGQVISPSSEQSIQRVAAFNNVPLACSRLVANGNLLCMSGYKFDRNNVVFECKLARLHLAPTAEHDLEYQNSIQSKQEIRKCCFMTSSSDGSGSVLALVCDNSVCVYDLTQTASTDASSQLSPVIEYTENATDDSPLKVYSACVNPSSRSELLTVGREGVKSYDLRAPNKSSLFAVSPLQDDYPLCIDHNPNVEHYFATGGMDNSVSIWDKRTLKCVTTFEPGHNHWIQSLKYNRQHDQCILTAGSDYNVCLYNCHSYSSFASSAATSPNAIKSAVPSKSSQQISSDFVVNKWESHDDSVYECCWSHSDPWTFASVSWDGCVSVSRVSINDQIKCYQ